MATTTSALFNLDAEVGSDEDESFDEETGDVREKANGTNGNLEDSSDEDDDDDDEAAAAEVREGFIVDEDDDNDEDPEEKRRKRRERKKRRREEREEEEGLDDEDLELIGDIAPRTQTEPKFKRLKRGHRDDRAQDEPRGVADIFADENDDVEEEEQRFGRREAVGEFDDFIEEDEFPDEERQQMLDDIEVSRRPKKGLGAITNLESSGLDEAGMEDMRAAFGDGTEYDWALELQEAMDDEQLDLNKELELKDVFEPSQLADKMLTDEDNIIRSVDVPERFQLAWKPFKVLDPESDSEMLNARIDEEAKWIRGLIWQRKRFEPELMVPFENAIREVLKFLIVEQFEVPFIFQHRKDYLIHAGRVPVSPDPNNPDAPDYEVRAEKLLDQGDLWEIMDLDLKFRAIVEKREALQRSYDNIKENTSQSDPVFEELLPKAISLEEIQDVQDYLQFQYSAELKDINTMNAETNGTTKRARHSNSLFERMRAGKGYRIVKAFGVSPDSFAQRASDDSHRGFTDDPAIKPEEMAEECTDESDFSTSTQVMRASKAMFAEELITSPRLRKFLRQKLYFDGRIDCQRTEKGLQKIDEDHPFYEIKYLRNQPLTVFYRRPELYLRMLKAEADGFIELQLRIKEKDRFVQSLYKVLQSDNVSEVSDAWNDLRKEVFDTALSRLLNILIRGVKENLRNECENLIARKCRDAYSNRLDQAPYKPRGMLLGTVPRVLAITNGAGHASRDAISWAWVEEDGRFLESGEFSDLRLGNAEKGTPDAPDVNKLVELISRRNPDVIAISGFSTEVRKLLVELREIIDRYDLRSAQYDDEDGNEQRDKIEVVIVNDETARLYYGSDRSKMDYPSLKPMTKYCIALAKYVQSPMKEYAVLGRDVMSVSFNENQHLLPQEKLSKYLETAMVDMVNLVGVDINEAVSDSTSANLLSYISGLGPRKAATLLQVITRNGGVVQGRDELIGDVDGRKLPAVTRKVWENCASFLYIEFDQAEPSSEYLDNTRVHPEDYELARKMASDALEMDEEDIQMEVQENGSQAIVRRLVREDAQEKVNDLILEMYAEQLENSFHQRKRATLETIRAELQQPYEELRKGFALLSSVEQFTMFTGETENTLFRGMVVPVAIKRIYPEEIVVRLDCGLEGTVQEANFPEGVGMGKTEPRHAFQTHQTVQARILTIDYRKLTVTLSMTEDALRYPAKKEIDRIPGEWDEDQEDADKRDSSKRKEQVTGRAQRVIKHPLFHPFNATQAEEFLGPQGRGDVIVRPSSKGLDHLAVTWKVADNVFQHIDVLELDKENEFSVGRVLKIGGKYTYSDLDELIVNHVKAMAKKVDEITLDERYMGSKADAEQWLNSYMAANPKRSMYAFCMNREYPGYFQLCYKATEKGSQRNWPIKIIPNAFELQKNAYPDMRALKNGFKTMFAHMQQQQPNGRR